MTLSDKFQSFRVFARKVGRLTLPYFQSEEKWKARILLAALVDRLRGLEPECPDRCGWS